MSNGFFRCEVKVHARVDSGNAVKSAAYQMAEKLKDERTGKSFRKFTSSDVQHTQIFLPPGVSEPDGFLKAGELWSEAEKAETRINSRVAREALISLPYNFSLDARKKAVELFCRWLSKSFGVVAMSSIHSEKFRPMAEALEDTSKRWFGIKSNTFMMSDRNAHAHVLFSTRRFDGQFKEKTREFDDKKTGPKVIKKIRKVWARVLNVVARAFGHPQKFSHLSLKARGINREPTKPFGLVGSWMESMGLESENGSYNRTVKKINSIREEFEAEERQARLEAEREATAKANLKAREKLQLGRDSEPEQDATLVIFGQKPAHEGPTKGPKVARVRKNKPNIDPDLGL